MRAVPSSLRLLASFFFALIVAPCARGQISSLTNQTSTPIPGAGHDYIKMLNETVNPANGSVSLRVQVPTPPGRNMSLPFAFAYDSSGTQHIESIGPGVYAWIDNTAYLAKGGWSYSLPMISDSKVTESLSISPNGKCIYYMNFVFQDASGGRHSLFVSMDFSTPSSCQNAIPVIPYEVLNGGDDYYQAAFTTPRTTAQLLVTDAHGTMYTLPFQQGVKGGSLGTYSTLPSSIEDTNGNLINIHASPFPITATDTLGRTLLSISNFGSTGDTVNASGLPNPYSVTWGSNSANHAMGSSLLRGSGNGCGNIPSLSGPLSVIKQITLPNNTAYTFSYDPSYGLLNKITYPNGGYVSYTWTLNTLSEFVSLEDGGGGANSCDFSVDAPAVSTRTVSFDGVHIALQQNFTYTTSSMGLGGWATKKTTVATTDNVTGLTYSNEYNYSPFSEELQPNDNSPFQPQIPLEQTVVTKNSAGTAIRTVTKSWFDQYELQSEQTKLEDNSTTSNTTYTYGPGAQVTSKSDYDFPSGTALIRKTVTNYQTFSATPIFPSGPSIFDRPCQSIVYDSTGSNRVAESDFFYDGSTSSTPCSTATTQTLTGTGSYTSHDETLYGTAASVARGNLTKVVKQCFQGSQSCASGNPATTAVYDETGQISSTTDPNNHTTRYIYADSYTVLSGGANISYTPSGNTNAFLTKITDPLTHTQNFTYDFNTSQLTISKDQNALTTTYLYNDPLARPTQFNSPDGGQTTVAYNDSAPSPSVTTTKRISSTTNLGTLAFMDGLGHVVQARLCEDGAPCTQPVNTDSAFDGLGRVHTQSNPHRGGSSPTDGTTTFYYDAIGRSCLVVPPDGTQPTGGVCPTTQPANDMFTTYSLNATTVADQAGKSRTSYTDGLGRLSQVFEDPGVLPPHLNYETDYTYDALGNLLSVNQKGGSTNSALWRTRAFVYDSLSRLTSSTNPESNTQPVSPFTIVPTTYVYDANGNLSTKTAPAPNQTGTGTVTTTFSYDFVNRLTQKSFSDTTPVVKYGYDAIAPPGCTLPALTIGNGIGKRTGMCDAAGAEAWSYDITAGTGWKLTDARTTNALTKSTIVQNNLLGSAATLTYPSGRVITYTFDAAARPISAIDSTGPINYATNALYAPTGALSSLTNGASLVSTLYYNNRLQPCRISVKNTGTAPATCADATTGNVLDFAYNFSVGTADNGNVTAITNNRDTTRSQTFAYDSLNRISTAKTTSTAGSTCWDEAFGYDPWGNLLTIGRISGYTCSNEELLNSSATPQNQITGDTYDTAGNITAIPSVATYTFNAENQLTATAGLTYAYDGDGKRVEKASGGTATKLYWYGMGSDALDETDAAGSTTNVAFNEYIFFGGQRIARRESSNNVTYYFSDHLGTARIVANSSGTPLDDSDFYPFGGERMIASSSGNRYKFTAKERDTESGLDNFGARYDSSSMGRFMSPDNPKFSEKTNPQTWNLYSYVSNNPLARVDLTGDNWFNINGSWQWYDGANVTNDGKACKQGTKGCNHSDYTHMLVIQKLDEKTDKGATKVKITLYDQNKVIAEASGFTGATGISPVPNGNYEINLNNRGGTDTNAVVAVVGGRALAPYRDGIQEISGNAIYNSSELPYDFRPDWGTLRANLSRGPGEGTAYYLHGKGLYFTEGHSYTTGCVCDPYQTVLKVIFRLDPSGVGEGDKNGRIAVSVNKAN
jgi:RHS repeat-associated protein